MKFLCVACNQAMRFGDHQLPGDGTMAVALACPACGREVLMLANPLETQMVSTLGIPVGGSPLPESPLDPAAPLAGAPERAAPDQLAAGRVFWSPEADTRLAQVPSFVRGMVKRIYSDYAKERGIGTITPAVMDRARSDLGLEGM
jgi:hypothetical protein